MARSLSPWMRAVPPLSLVWSAPASDAEPAAPAPEPVDPTLALLAALVQRGRRAQPRPSEGA